MYRYEQHCPIARAAEVLTEPWTLLIVRELLRGSERRAEIAMGLPKMSDSLLRSRLRVLENHGVITHDGGELADRCYRLTTAGQELQPIVEHLGRWGQRWLDRPRVGDLDPELLVFDICRGIDSARLPADPLTVEVEFADAPPPRRWWLTLSASEVLANRSAEQDASVRLTCTLGALAGVWLGHLSWLQAVRDRIIMFAGDRAAVRSLIGCLGVSRYADEDRPAGTGSLVT